MQASSRITDVWRIVQCRMLACVRGLPNRGEGIRGGNGACGLRRSKRPQRVKTSANIPVCVASGNMRPVSLVSLRLAKHEQVAGIDNKAHVLPSFGRIDLPGRLRTAQVLDGCRQMPSDAAVDMSGAQPFASMLVALIESVAALSFADTRPQWHRSRHTDSLTRLSMTNCAAKYSVSWAASKRRRRAALLPIAHGPDIGDPAETHLHRLVWDCRKADVVSPS